MDELQKQFEKFHEIIRLDYEMNESLREKRDIIIDKIRKHFREKERPSFVVIHQGSYKLRTGVCPIGDLEYDIDIGLVFEDLPEGTTASEVRTWVYESICDHTDDVQSLRNCIRVCYAKEKYHVDLVSYSLRIINGAEQFELASKNDGWRPAEPTRLVEILKEKLKSFQDAEDSATGTNQFRRIVRYLKRWNDFAIPKESKDRPSGLALTLMVYYNATKSLKWHGSNYDIGALKQVAEWATSTFGRIEVRKLTQEYEDLLAGLSDDAMNDFKDRFKVLLQTLKDAEKEEDLVKACKSLQKVFGPDFPVPEKKKEGLMVTAAPAIVPGSSSA